MLLEGLELWFLLPCILTLLISMSDVNISTVLSILFKKSALLIFFYLGEGRDSRLISTSKHLNEYFHISWLCFGTQSVYVMIFFCPLLIVPTLFTRVRVCVCVFRSF